MGRLSTHVLDLSLGRPAQGVRVELRRLVDGGAELLATRITDVDGRTGGFLSESALAAGKYQLLFYVREYFEDMKVVDAGRFLDVVPIEFIVPDPAAAYHVPLLVSPWGYTTYRGS
jgi:5-hydroxyisourate hydrolase